MKQTRFSHQEMLEIKSTIPRNKPFTLLYLLIFIMIGVSCSQASGQESFEHEEITDTQPPPLISSVTLAPTLTFTPEPTNTSTAQPTSTPIYTNTSTYTPIPSPTFSLGDYLNSGCIHSDFWIPKNPDQANTDELGCWDLEPFGFLTNMENVISVRPPFNIFEYWIYYPISNDAIKIQCTVKFYNLSNDFFRLGFSGDELTPNPINSFLSYRQSGTAVVSASYRNSSNQIIDVLHEKPKFPHYITVTIDNGDIEIVIDDKHTSPPWRVIDSISKDKTGFWIEYYVNNGLSYSLDLNDCEFIIE